MLYKCNETRIHTYIPEPDLVLFFHSRPDNYLARHAKLFPHCSIGRYTHYIVYQSTRTTLMVTNKEDVRSVVVREDPTTMNILLAASMNELLQPLRTKQYTILNKKDERTSNNRYKVELLS
jgi:hypothetical protein